MKEINLFIIDGQEPLVDSFIGSSSVANLEAVADSLNTVVGIGFGTTVSNGLECSVVVDKDQSSIATALRVDFEVLGDDTSRDSNSNIHTRFKTGSSGGTDGDEISLLCFSGSKNDSRICARGDSVSGNEGVWALVDTLSSGGELSGAAKSCVLELEFTDAFVTLANRLVFDWDSLALNLFGVHDCGTVHARINHTFSSGWRCGG